MDQRFPDTGEVSQADIATIYIKINNKNNSMRQTLLLFSFYR